MTKSTSAVGPTRDRKTAYGPPTFPYQPSGSVSVIFFGNGVAATYVPAVSGTDPSRTGMSSEPPAADGTGVGPADGVAVGAGLGVLTMAPGSDGWSPTAATATTSATTAAVEAAMRRTGVMQGNLG